MSDITVTTFVEGYEEKFRATDGTFVGVGYTEDEARKALADATAESMRKTKSQTSFSTKPEPPEAA